MGIYCVVGLFFYENFEVIYVVSLLTYFNQFAMLIIMSLRAWVLDIITLERNHKLDPRFQPDIILIIPGKLGQNKPL
jgi:hypothetical protein